MLPRVLEPEVMDSPEEARDYDAMDHSQVNRAFVADVLAFMPKPHSVLDVGTGTAQIPIELCRQDQRVQVLGVDLAEHMLAHGRENVRSAGLEDRIELRKVDAKKLPLATATFDGVLSNSIIHHIPAPRFALAEMIRVTTKGGALFVRDLLRPEHDDAVRQLVQLHVRQANTHQRDMFEASLRAALTLKEIQALVHQLEFDPREVKQTSDRHWTWQAKKI